MTTTPTAVPSLAQRLLHVGPRDAARALAGRSDAEAASALSEVHHGVAAEILEALEPARRAALLAAVPAPRRAQWEVNLAHPSGTVGRIMAVPHGLVRGSMTVAEATEALREIVKQAFVTYLYVVDGDGRLQGVVVMREMLLAPPGATLEGIMLRDPFALRPQMPQMDAMKAVLGRHYPVYPVCDDAGRLVGLVRGSTLFERQAIELTAQAGAMVGVEKEERLATPWPRSLRSRHPWLQLNLLTGFVAAAVVGAFEGTIERIVALAVFLPVMQGQAANTGCQALAVTLRGMTLGELGSGRGRRAASKEAWLGVLNGALVGLTAGAGMWAYAASQGNASAFVLGVVVFLAMVGACIVAGVFGVWVPILLKRMGADPATASSIFLTTVTDVASMGLFLLLATVLA